jgi:hypothetical protein
MTSGPGPEVGSDDEGEEGTGSGTEDLSDEALEDVAGGGIFGIGLALSESEPGAQGPRGTI